MSDLLSQDLREVAAEVAKRVRHGGALMLSPEEAVELIVGLGNAADRSEAMERLLDLAPPPPAVLPAGVACLADFRARRAGGGAR